MRNKRGFTLAEAMITMALVVVSALFAVSICVYCTSQTQRMYAQFQSSNIPQDVLNCFFAAREEHPGDLGAQNDLFEDYLRYYTGYASLECSVDEYVTADYSFTAGGLKTEIQAQFASGILYVFVYSGQGKTPVKSFGYNAELRIELEV